MMPPAATSPVRLLAQGMCYALFAVFIVYFATSPSYRMLPPDSAQLKLSVSHAGERRSECRRLSPEEIAALAENMRLAVDCDRERVPVRVELEVDGVTIYAAEHEPSGLFRDGSSNVYRRMPLAAGEHRVRARLRDNRSLQGFDHEHEEQVTIAPGQNFVVQFDASAGGFRFR